MAKHKESGGYQGRRDRFFQKGNSKQFRNQNRQNKTADLNKDAPSSSGSFFVKPDETTKKTNDYSNKPKFSDKVKKPFDKKKYRLQKYSKKYKIEQWEEKQKKIALRQYHKQLKHETPGFDIQQIYAEANEEDIEEESNEPKISRGRKPFVKPHEEFLRIQDEKQKRKEEIARKKAEREEAVKASRKKKAERSKKLGKKTKRGQPVMKERIELLLEKIQSSSHS